MIMNMPERIPGCQYCKYDMPHPADSDCPLAKDWNAFYSERKKLRDEYLDSQGEEDK